MESKQQSKFTGQLDDIKGKPYMRAHSAIAWFREDWPVSEASILTTCIQTEPIVWQAEIWIGDRVAARAHATQTNVNKDHGKLETNAVRRALALCGYGTETALGDDDFDAETGDSLNAKGRSATNGNRPAASQGNGSNAASAPTQTQQPREITPLTTATLGNTHGPIKGEEKPTPNGDGYSDYHVTQVVHQPTDNTWVLKTREGKNVVMYGSDAFRNATPAIPDSNIEMWKKLGKMTMEREMIVRAGLFKNQNNDGMNWKVASITLAQTELDAVFN